jgi:hypothetical protein
MRRSWSFVLFFYLAYCLLAHLQSIQKDAGTVHLITLVHIIFQRVMDATHVLAPYRALMTNGIQMDHIHALLYIVVKSLRYKIHLRKIISVEEKHNDKEQKDIPQT